MTQSSRQELNLMDLRRRRAFKTETKRLDTLLSYERGTDTETLMHMGRYRTLQRRIYNYSRTSPTFLDMRRLTTKAEGNRLLFRGFAAVVRNLYPGARRSSHFIKVIHHPSCKRFLQRVFKDTEVHDEEHAWRNWMDIEQEQREKYWDLLLLYLVDRNPDRSLQFLRVIARDPSLDLNAPVLADSFEILARRYLKGEMTGMRNRASFVPTFCHIFRQCLAEIKPVCTQDLLLSVAKLAHADDLKLVWHLIEDKVFWGYDTLLHWASTFGEQGQHKHALLCLAKVVHNMTNIQGKQDLVDRERFRWSCALVLRKSVVNGENYDMTADIVAQFLKLGVKLDILLYNVVMNNAMEAGDYSVAFRVFNLLEENGVKPDKFTYSILLHGCTLAENPPMFRDFAVHCEKMAKELQDPWLATDCLYYEYICHHNRDETHIDRVFPVLHHAYSQFFTLEPLSWLPTDYDATAQRHAIQQERERQLQLQPDSQESQDTLHEPTPLMEPSQVAIYLMLQTEIRRAISISTAAVWNLYLLFRNQVRSRQNPHILKLAHNPIIWNAFLLAFCRAQQFANASHLIKSMPAPNVYSWNIFMQAFFKSEQIQAAEKVWEIMKTRKVEPDQFSWTTLLRGYARGQRVEKVGGVMENLDKEKQLHPAILAALGRMTDRESLMRELEKARRVKERKEANKLKEEENKRLGRWELPRFEPLIKKKGEEVKVGDMGTTLSKMEWTPTTKAAHR
jgi:pentatricopeptide repeat protein